MTLEREVAGPTSAARSPGRRTAAIVLGVLAVGSHLAFVAIAAARAYSMGICCADDSVYAEQAKNLATGVGYATTIQHDTHDFGVRLFDPYMGTGPAAVLPVALAVRVLGNALWVPGVTTVALWTALLWAIYGALRRLSTEPERRHLAVLAFSYVAFALTLFHSEHWSALLGEVPAALLVVLAIALWATAPTPRRHFSAGVILCLAVLAKTLAALYVIAFLVAVALDSARPRDAADGRVRRGLLAVAAGLALPATVLETWKLATLGPSLYATRVRETFQFVGAQGLGAPESLLARVTRLCQDFYDTFSASVVEVFLFTAAASLAMLLHRQGALRRFGLAAGLGLAANAAYWLFLSVGWSRYLIMAVVVASATIALSMLAWPRRWLVAWAAAVLFWLVPTWGRMGYPLTLMDRGWFRESTAAVNLRRAADYLSRYARGRIVVGEWWATMVDLEYASSAPLVFKGYRALPALPERSTFLLVVNERFASNRDAGFAELKGSCGAPVLDAAPYRVYECPGAASARPTSE
jgi:hypothetical protein